MSTLPQRPATQPGDGLGYRVLGFDKKTGDRLEMLRVRPQFSAQPAFEQGLRERLRRLAEFHSPAFARVRQIDRLTGQAAGIAIVSNHVEGVRLADVLAVAESHQVRVDIDTTLSLVRQLTSAIASLHTCGQDISHGCIAPERLLLTPDAKLVVTEYVLGGALEAMQWSREKFWQEFRIALPATGTTATFDQAADIMQVGLLALALLEGRSIYAERQYPLPFAERLKQAREIPVSGTPQPLKPAFQSWLTRALQLDAGIGFRDIDDALVALDLVIGEGYLAQPAMVAAFVDRCRQASPEFRPKEEDKGDDAPRSAKTAIDVGPSGVGSTPAGKAGEVKPAGRITQPLGPPATPGAPATGPLGTTPTATQPGAPGKPASIAPGAASATPGGTTPIKTAPHTAAQGKPAVPAAPAAAAPAAKTGTPETPAIKLTETRPDAKADPRRSAADKGSADKQGADRQTDRHADRKAERQADRQADKTGPIKVSGGMFGGDEMVDDSSGLPGEVVKPAGSGMRMPLIAAAVIGIVALGGFVAVRYGNVLGNGIPAANTPALPASVGILAIDASPKAATVFIDDVARGTTPLRLELSPGQHSVRLDAGDNVTRTFPVTVAAGKEVSQLVELTRNLDTGGLEVRSDPGGARVLLDGKPVGTSPVSLNDIPPGDHIVVVEGPQGQVRQTVKVIAGTRSAIVVPLNPNPASPAAGWLSVEADHELQVLQDGQLLGTSRTEKLMLPAGNYNLEFTNDAMEFRVNRSVQVAPGRIVRVSVPIPDGTLSVNATPWAEVWVDGSRIGETPVGNLPIRAGTHELVFRNPKTAEKRQTIVVRPGQPARVTMDMTK